MVFLISLGTSFSAFCQQTILDTEEEATKATATENSDQNPLPGIMTTTGSSELPSASGTEPLAAPSGTDTTFQNMFNVFTYSLGGSGSLNGADGSSWKETQASESDPTLSAKAIKVAQVAASFPQKYPTKGSFKYAPLTEDGNLGCANVVSKALKESGVKIRGDISVDRLKGQLKRAGWKTVKPPPYKPGDVIVWGPGSNGTHKHIGIIARNGNTLMAMNNSSDRRHPVWSDINYRKVEAVLRQS
jgi:cell wall-associated NlpC family hydrolase